MLFEQINDQEPISDFSLIPANVREYASKHNVGVPLMLYPRTRLLLWSLIGRALSAVFLLGITIYLAILYIGIIFDYTYALSNILKCIVSCEMLIFVFFTPIFLLSFLSDYRNYREKLYVCQDGLLRLGWRKEEAIRWDEVTDMYGSSDQLVAVQQAGRAVFVIAESWSCNAEISRRIANNLTERLWYQTLERFETGVLLPFGKLFIVSAGIRYGRKLIAWEEIEDVWEKNGWLMFKIKGKRRGWMSVERQGYQVSNLPLIVSLTKHVIRSRLVNVLTARAMRLRESQSQFE